MRLHSPDEIRATWPRAAHAIALDRNELGGLLVAAGLGRPAEHALISLLALNGPRGPRRPEPTSSTSVLSAGTGPC